jgi:hypothetical protein
MGLGGITSVAMFASKLTHHRHQAVGVGISAVEIATLKLKAFRGIELQDQARHRFLFATEVTR